MNAVTDDLTDLEKDALQEIMNIGFGRAAADLAEILNLHVILSVPYISVLESDKVLQYLHSEIPDSTDMSMITQYFSGKFSGSSFLVFHHSERRKLLCIFDEEDSLQSGGDIDLLEKESLMEIGNLIMGACVGKVADMLGDIVTYTPPRFFSQDQIHPSLSEFLKNDDSFAILFKTVFSFEQYNVNGYQFVISQHSIMPWLKSAIARFLAPYA